MAQKVVGNAFEIAPYFLGIPEAKGLLTTIDTIGLKTVSQISRQEGLQFAKAYGTKIASTALGLGTMFGLGRSIKEGADAKTTATNIAKSIGTIALLEMTLSPLIKYGISKATGKTTVQASVDKILDENKDLIVSKVEEIKSNPELKLPELPKLPETKIDIPKENIKPKINTDVKPVDRITPIKSDTANPLNFRAAEDYVKAQGTPVYHGSDVADIIEKEGFKKMPIKTGVSAFGEGSYLTTSKSNAKGYGGVVNGYLPQDIKLKIISDSDAYTINTKKLIEEGYDGVELFTGNSKNITIFEPSKIKTKSQLISEWNKAQEVKPTKPVITQVKTEQNILQSSVYKRLQNEIPEKYREDVSYSKQNLIANAKKAVDLVATDKNKAYQIGMGLKSAPEGQTSAAVNIALAAKALKDKNYSLYAELIKNRSLAQVRRGQEIVAERGSVTDNSTARYVKELISAKLDDLGNRYSFDINTRKLSPKEKAIKIIDKEVDKYEKVVYSKRIDIREAQNILDKLICK